MADLVNHIIDNSKKDGDLDTLRKTLENNLDKIRSNGHMLPHLIQALDAEKHSLGMAYLLFIRSTLPQLDISFVDKMEALLTKCNVKQVQRCADRFTSAVHRYTEICRENSMLARGIKFLKIGLERFRKNSDYLTPLHADFLCLCLKAKYYKQAVQLLDSCKILDVDPNITGTTPRDMMLYYYYGGMVYTGLKKFEKAARFYEGALTVPAAGMSAIMVESYKKLVLVSLLLNGKFVGVSKHAANVVHRHMKAYCAQYLEFSNAFADGDMDKVLKVAAEHNELFVKENNGGLIYQCISALRRRNIQKLTETYMTLSLVDIAKAIKVQSVKDAETQLLRMIEDGEIAAVINQKDGMVSFEQEVQSFKSPNTGAILEARIDEVIGLANRLKAMDDEIGSSTQYIARLHGVREDMLEMGDRGRMMGGMGVGGRLGRMLDTFFR